MAGSAPGAATCSAWLKPTQDPNYPAWDSFIPLVLNDHRYAHGIYEREQVVNGQIVKTIEEDVAASTNGRNRNENQSIGPQNASFLVNDNGLFYKSAPSQPNTRWLNKYGANNPRAQAETLLHELAHLIRPVTLYGPNGPLAGLNLPDLFEEDFGTARSSAAQQQNARTLLANCQKFIETFPK